MKMNLIQETRVFSDALDRLPLPAGVSHVYNPLSYMRAAHERWLERFVPCGYEQVAPQTIPITSPVSRPYLILGMNPGPWGMVQTGLPFGDVVNAGTILGLSGLDEPWWEHNSNGVEHVAVPRPWFRPDLQRLAAVHPKRPVQGFACARREPSGERLWGGLTGVFRPSAPTQGCAAEHRQGRHELYIDEHHTMCRACGQEWNGGTDRKPALDAVLAQCFAVNYCPLAYFAADPQGTNVTPDAFRKAGVHRDLPYANDLDALCGAYIASIMRAFGTRVVLAVGRYAEAMAKVIVASAMPADARPEIVYLTHPSPRSTRSVDEWAAMARREMTAAGVLPGSAAVEKRGVT